MSRSRIIDFRQAPPSDCLGEVLEDYVGETARVVPFNGGWTAYIGGLNSWALARQDQMFADKTLADRENGLVRGFEVHLHVGDAVVSVVTRHADEFTNAVADEFAAVVARFWGGTVMS